MQLGIYSPSLGVSGDFTTEMGPQKIKLLVTTRNVNQKKLKDVQI